MTSNEQNPPERSGIEGLAPVNRKVEPDREAEPYDATRDPRTGRPPNPLEAQRLAREHEQERLAQGTVETHGAETGIASASESVEDNDEPDASPVPPGQAPARMAAPHLDKDEKAAVDALVQEGVTREYAEELVATHGTNWETLKAAAFAEDNFEKSNGQQTEST